MKKKDVEFSGTQKGHVALFWKGQVISGECRFTAIKTKKKGGDAIFEIHLVKPLT
jgi:hypothetical protein